jgi:hypothetical protein
MLTGMDVAPVGLLGHPRLVLQEGSERPLRVGLRGPLARANQATQPKVAGAVDQRESSSRSGPLLILPVGVLGSWSRSSKRRGSL